MATTSTPVTDSLTSVADDFYVFKQPTEDELRAIAKEGVIKTVINMRPTTEDGYLASTEELCKEGGLAYIHMPRSTFKLDHDDLDAIAAQLSAVAKPALVHCRSGGRATVAVIAHLACSDGSCDPTALLATAGFEKSPICETVVNYVTGKQAKASEEVKTDEFEGLALRKVSDDYYTAAQPTEDHLRRLAATGLVKSVVNMRPEDEDGFLASTAALCMELGLTYLHIPRPSFKMEASELDAIAAQVDALPKPVLVHCRSGVRAGLVVLANSVCKDGSCDTDALVVTLGLHEKPAVVMEAAKGYVAVKRAGGDESKEEDLIMKKVSDDFYISGQPTEAQLEKLAAEGIIKSVVNMRPTEEPGSLLFTKALCDRLGLTYCHMPRSTFKLDQEDLDSIADQLASLPKPALVHCRSGTRAAVAVMAHEVCTDESCNAEAMLSLTGIHDKPPVCEVVMAYVTAKNKSSAPSGQGEQSSTAKSCIVV